MSTVARVRLWGRTIGAVALNEGETTASFEYAKAFLASGIQLAPLAMPLADRIYRFPELAPATFHGLPGLLADCLPDKFGTRLVDAWLARQGREPGSMNPVERLCYTGSRGMGALEFEPHFGPPARQSRRLELDALVALASEILDTRGNLRLQLGDDNEDRAMAQLLRVGTSAGGARAKAVIAWHPKTQEVRSGPVDTEAGFEHWLLKFDGVSGNRDHELDDPKGFGAIEFAYWHMAQAAGIHMSECRLLEENGRRHFMTRRFDRTVEGGKLHMQSLGALAHLDYNLPGAHGYEQAVQVIRKLDLGMAALEQMYRRAVFNVLARNHDDHVKNIAFLMDKQGAWSLSPAFDLVYSYNPDGDWTARHQMSLNGKRQEFAFEDFKALAAVAGLKRGRDKRLFREVRDAVLSWPEHARKAGLSRKVINRIKTALRADKIQEN